MTTRAPITVALLILASAAWLPAGPSAPATRPATASANPPAATTAPAGSVVFPVPADVRRVAFVCDATGTMVKKMDALRAELNKAVAALRPDQSFNVILFVDDGVSPRDTPWVIAADPAGLMPATDDNKRKVRQLLADVTVSGQTNPHPAVKMAFRQQPQLIYFLTDGEYNSITTYDEVVNTFKACNREGRVRVNTVSFDTVDEDAVEHLREIARNHRGTFLDVTVTDGVARPRPATRPAPR